MSRHFGLHNPEAPLDDLSNPLPEKPPSNTGWWLLILLYFAVAIVVCALLISAFAAKAHMHDRQDLEAWLETLYSGRAPCCDSGEASRITDPNWASPSEMKKGAECSASAPINGESSAELVTEYCVRLQDPFNNEWKWWAVPHHAVVELPNRAGPALIWLAWINSGDNVGTPYIRCFLPGSGA